MTGGGAVVVVVGGVCKDIIISNPTAVKDVLSCIELELGLAFDKKRNVFKPWSTQWFGLIVHSGM